jgi:hypothetical protein
MKTLRIGLLCTLLFLSLSCKLLSGQPQPQYDNPAYSFTYPKTWQTMADLFPQYQAGREYYGLGLSETVMVTSARKQGESGAYFAVASAPLPAGSNLESAYRHAYAPIMGQLRQVSESAVEAAGQPGFEIRYKRPWGEPWWQFRELWLEKDGVIYLLSFHAAPGGFDDMQEDFDAILDSFTFK